jgi:peptidyl-prolyl cis-trans isomerase A (cyclophilin A)
MGKYVWFGLFALLLLALLSGCPRKQPQPAPTLPPAAGQPSGLVKGAGGETGTPPAEAPPAGEAPAPGTETPPAAGQTQPGAEQPGATTPPEGKMPGETAQTGTTEVVFETTKGNIVLTVHGDWAPLGAAHFLELVNAKFYDGAPWFRVMEGFVAQCGISADPALNKEWGEKTINDEPVKQGNEAWYVAFGKTSQPNSRSTHIFINLSDNTRSLDPQGFACFAQVTDGQDVAQNLFRCVYQDQGGLAAQGGLAQFKQMFPNADYIKKAYVRGAASAPAPSPASPSPASPPAGG